MNYKDTMTYQVNYVKYKEAIKRWLEIYHKKEVKKVKIPYFEMKVVKVKEKKIELKVKTLILKRIKAYENKGKDRYIKVKFNDPKLYLYRHENSKVGDEAIYPDRKIWKIIEIIEPKEPPGNWINGENLDAIKFPCFCSYIFGNHKFYGEIDKNWDDLAYDWVYQISQRNQQTKQLSVVLSCNSLEEMFENHKVHILKGKIIIFEEEK